MRIYSNGCYYTLAGVELITLSCTGANIIQAILTPHLLLSGSSLLQAAYYRRHLENCVKRV